MTFNFHERKWYVQPFDPGSAEKIHKFFKARGVKPSDKKGLRAPEYNGYNLMPSTWRDIQTLLTEANDGAVLNECGKWNDFGLNFYVYSEKEDEEEPVYAFATTSALRAQNRKVLEKEPGVWADLYAIDGYKRQKETPIDRIFREKITQPPAREKQETEPRPPKIKTRYGISTPNQKTALILMELLKENGEPSTSVEHLRVNRARFWKASATVVLRLKSAALSNFLMFSVWRLDGNGNYDEIQRWPKSLESTKEAG